MRLMQSDDLGDTRLYEDEAIREQAARLQLHVQNLRSRILKNGIVSVRTYLRIRQLDTVTGALEYRCKKMGGC